MTRYIDGPAGRIEALLDAPESPRVAVVVAHPHPLYGGTMHNKVVYQIAKGLRHTGAAVLRFNFRGVGASAGAWDDGAGELADMRAALDYVAALYPGVELWAGGFSFGAWAAMTAGATDNRVSVLIGVAPPAKEFDFSALDDCAKPKFFIHGTLDSTCPLKDTLDLYSRVPEPKEFVEVDGADHLFDGQVTEVSEAIQGLLGDFSAKRGPS
jgi:alpha/beta superfamily hydrolase